MGKIYSGCGIRCKILEARKILLLAVLVASLQSVWAATLEAARKKAY